MKAWELTTEEHIRLHEDFFGEGSGGCEIDDSDLCIAVAKAAQRKLVEWLENNDDMNIELMSRKALEEWQQLKEDLEE